MNLRPYQREASDAVFAQWREVPSTLVVMPTGLGKTILFANVIKRAFPRRAMVLAHREELIFQAVDKIQRSTGLACEIEMAGSRATLGGLFGRAQVVVSTIQTQTAGGDGGGRMSRFNPQEFGVLVIDEAHHATATTYRKCLQWYRTNPELRVLGVTATPDRADEEALGQVYDTVAFDYEILDAIQEGWLAPIEQQMVTVEGLDFSSVRTTAGDLNGADLASIMEYERNLHAIASPTLDLIGQRRALVFAASVAHAERLAEIFNRHRAGMAAWICGKTDKEERRKVLADFAAGRVQVVCNCGVLTEGFDDPGVEVVIMGRPTKSRALYAQMVGRATRPLPGVVDGEGKDTAEARRAAIAASAKPCCLVVDFVGVSGQHKLMTTGDLLGGKVSPEIVAAAVARARSGGKPVRMDEALAEEQRRAKERADAEAARRARVTVKASFQANTINPFDLWELEPVTARGWDTGRQLSEKQRGLLARQGIDPDGLPYAQARQVLNEMFRRWDQSLCTLKQAKVLARYGYATKDLTMADATKLIDALAQNGWKRAA